MPNVTWSRDLAAHLLRRAGFGATEAELDQYEALGLEQAVAKLVDYESVSNANLDALLAQLNLDLTRGGQLQTWWLVRMLNTARPLEEKMAFFWHNYFATSISKVGPEAMKIQNDLLRAMAMGNFHDFLVAISKDPAMLDWLDNRINRVGRPNENYGRELLELFSMGEGNGYTETDVQEVARCFTGWTTRQGAYYFQAGGHDNGPKTVLGVSIPAGGGESDGITVCDILAGRPETGRYLAARLLDAFVYPNPSTALIEKIAAVYYAKSYSVREMMRAIFLSDEFWSDKAILGHIKSPTEFAVGALKALGATVDYRRLSAEISLMGQTLLAPPDVFGWDGGLTWINTTTLLARANFANALATNRENNPQRPRGHYFDPNALLVGENVEKPKKLVNVLLDTLGPLTLSKKQMKPLKTYAEVDDSGNKVEFELDTTTVDKKVRGLVHLIMTLPEYQMN
jgi:uncharacterized protein (DUF1800 family)